MYPRHKLVSVAGALLYLFLSAYAYCQKGPKSMGKPASNVPTLGSLNARIAKLEARVKEQDEEIGTLRAYAESLGAGAKVNDDTVRAMVGENKATKDDIRNLYTMTKAYGDALTSHLNEISVISHFSYLCTNPNAPESFTWLLRVNECFVIVDRQYTTLAK